MDMETVNRMWSMSGVVDDYLARLPRKEREALQHLRGTISAAVPSVEEVIRVGVPQFRYRGRPLVSMGAAQRHLSLYVMYGSVLARFETQLAGYDWSKTVVRFTPNQPLPDDLVTAIVRARVAELGGDPEG
jgi:uncharacterized protein YdhG (YjbR/CyaY superfamily)